MSPRGALRGTSEGQYLNKLDFYRFWRPRLTPQDPLLNPKVTWTGTFGPACERNLKFLHHMLTTPQIMSTISRIPWWRDWRCDSCNVGGPTFRDTPDVRSNDFKRGGHVEIFFSGGLALRALPPPSSDSSPL